MKPCPKHTVWTCVIAGLLAGNAALAQARAPAAGVPEVGRLRDQRDLLRRMAKRCGPVGTYEEYLERDPLRPANFGGRPLTFVPPDPHDGGRAPMIAVLVDSDLRPAVEASLLTYAADLTADGYSVYIDDVSGGTPPEIRDWVRQRYQAGAEGILFVGGIRVAWFEIPGDPFPCDLYYMDVDGNWTDASSNGINDTHTPGSGDRGPEVYVARLYTPTLSWDTEANLVNDYFEKDHGYHTGTLTLPRRGLEFIDHDWIYWFYVMGSIYGENVVRWDWGHLVRTDKYLSELARGYHYVQVAVHSGPDRHFFSNYPTNAVCYAHVYVYSPVARSAKLKLGSCDGIKAWLNGVNVVTQDTFQGWQMDQWSVAVTLNEGWNRLLCKISTLGGPFEFSARFTDVAGQPLSDLRYQTDNPEAQGERPYAEPGSHIGTWLLNGLYENSDNATRLRTDYLGNEDTVCPGAGELAAYGRWQRASRSGCPFNLAAYIESVYPPGEQCRAQYIQDVDPQAFFYNLFSCSAGRITESNYISASYILNTSFGLACVASSRSGSMTEGDLFASAFGDGRSFGQAYYDWWLSMEPYYPQNIGWWYGLILNGDPVLRCAQPFEDCNRNGVHDPDEIAADPDMDCDENGIPDECDFAAGRAHDCNGNGLMDVCDIASGSSIDCNGNEIPDECDLETGASPDCNENDVPDECDVRAGTSPDCNHNDVPDECDIAAGTSTDFNGNGVPDECEMTVRYVNAAAAPGGNGFSWGTAYDSLQEALAAAEDEPIIREIWVAAGTYTTGDRFALVGGVPVYGGFSGAETSLAQRDWQANETILDGSDYGAAEVVYVRECVGNTRLDGFTIRRGAHGVHVSGGEPTIANCRIVDNHGTCGAGVYVIDAGDPHFIDCVISGNEAIWGGAVYNGHLCGPTFVRCTITDNTADSYGGGFYDSTSNDLTLVNSVIGNNSAREGAAIFNEYANILMCYNCVFHGNDAAEVGGAFSNQMSTYLMVRNCTLVDNVAPMGGTVACLAETPDVACTVDFANSIVWGAGAGVWNTNDVSIIEFRYSDVVGGWDGDGNITGDPCFVDAVGDDYRLAAGSPCIDAAQNGYVPFDTLDVDADGEILERLPLDVGGLPRFVDDPSTTDTGVPSLPQYPTIADIGAHEFGIPCDLDGDCDVDLNDLAQLLAAYGTVGQTNYEDGDVDNDGDVNLSDLAALLAVYGSTCP
jgi:hypothetical protein